MIDTIYLDLDDTLNDFTPKAVHALGGKFEDVTDYDRNDICGACGVTPSTFYKLMSRADFWASLEVTELGKRLYSELAKFDVDIIVVTCVPAPHKQVSNERLVMCQARTLAAKHFWLTDHGFKSWAIVTEKWRLAGPTKLLIDDNQHRTAAFEDAGGYAITVPQPWNNEDRDPIQQLRWHLNPCPGDTLDNGTIGDEFCLTPDPASDMIELWEGRINNENITR